MYHLSSKFLISSASLILSVTTSIAEFIVMPRPEKRTSDTAEQTKLTDLIPIEPPASTTPSPNKIQWIANKHYYYPFSEATGSDIVEFRVHGTVMEPYLKGGPDSFSHSVLIDLSDDNADLLKSYIYTTPNYHPRNFQWPLDVNAAKFVSKNNVSKPFQDVWEIADEQLVRDEDCRSPISFARVKKGTPVWVEYTFVAYNGKKSTKDAEGFDPGVTLRLLSIGMLNGTGDESRFNFGSIKKRRIGGK